PPTRRSSDLGLRPCQLPSEPPVVDQTGPLKVGEGRRHLLLLEPRGPQALLELSPAPPTNREESERTILRGTSRLLGVAVLHRVRENPLGADQPLPLSWPAPR